MKKEVVKISVTLTGIKAYGNTFPFRHELKKLGFRWSPELKCWYLDFNFNIHQAGLDFERDEELVQHLNEFANELEQLGFRKPDIYTLQNYYGIYAIAYEVIIQLKSAGVPVTIA